MYIYIYVCIYIHIVYMYTGLGGGWLLKTDLSDRPPNSEVQSLISALPVAGAARVPSRASTGKYLVAATDYDELSTWELIAEIHS